MPGVENWCHKPEELLHHRHLVQWLSIVIGARLGGRWTSMGTGSLHFFWVKLVVERALEDCPRWCSAKSEADAAAASACRACCGVTTGTCWPLVDGRVVFLGVCTSASGCQYKTPNLGSNYYCVVCTCCVCLRDPWRLARARYTSGRPTERKESVYSRSSYEIAISLK